MRTCFLSCCPLACFAVFVAAGVSSAKTPPLPPDFGSDDAWRDHDIALVRVVRVEPNGKEPPTVYLRTERSYTGQKDTGDTTVPLIQSVAWWEIKFPISTGGSWPASSSDLCCPILQTGIPFNIQWQFYEGGNQ